MLRRVMLGKPVIFISAVSSELRGARDLVAKTLLALGYEPKWQDIAAADAGDLCGVLRKWVDESAAVIQLVGHRYGFEPKEADAQFGRVSYTQYEALYARQRGKRVWYLLLDPAHPVEAAAPEPAELQQLQAAYRERVRAYGDLYHPTDTLDHTRLIIHNLRDELARLRRRGQLLAAAILALLMLIGGGVWWLKSGQEQQGGQLQQVAVQQQQMQGQMSGIVERYNKMEQALIKLAAAELRATQAGDQPTQEEKRQRAYALLETELGLPVGSLAKELPGFALEIYSRPDTTRLMRAHAAYALNKFAEAEQLFLESAALDAKAQSNAEAVAAKLREQRIEALSGAGNAALAQIQYVRATGHLRAAAALTDVARDPAQWAAVQHLLAMAYWFDGHAVETAAILQRVIPVCQRALGPEHHNSLTSRSLLAVALNAQGKFAEAEAEHRAVLAVQQRVLGVEHPDALGSRNNLAITLTNQSQYAAAAAEHRAVLAVQERVLGPEHPDTLSSRHNLANALNAQGQHPAAEAEHRAVRAIRERVLGAAHPDTLKSRSNMAVVLTSQGKHAEAAAEHRAVLAVAERVLGAAHPDTLLSRGNLAVALLLLGRHAEAEAEQRSLLAIYERTLGAEHPTTLASRDKVANALLKQGKHAAAETECRAVLALRQRVLGAAHHDTLLSQCSLALSLALQGKPGAALPHAQQAWTGLVKGLGAQHPDSQMAERLVQLLRQEQ